MRQRGFVKSYDPETGFGFLESMQGEEFFVHRTALSGGGWLECGMDVEFEASEPGRATTVVVLAIRRVQAAGA
jgi:cold shock CspA family protein